MRSTSTVAGCAAAMNGIRNMTKPWNPTTVGRGGVGLYPNLCRQYSTEAEIMLAVLACPYNILVLVVK